MAPRLLTSLLILFICELSHAVVCISHSDCNDGNTTSSSAKSASSGAGSGSKIRINPAAVPTDRGFGVETIYYDQDFDFALVQGLGRVGAGISPSNGEETFFGPPGLEETNEFFERKAEHKKFEVDKITLAAAVQVYSNRRTDLRRFTFNVGALGKYNSETGAIRPGGGISGTLGFIRFGYSYYQDQSRFNSVYAPAGEAVPQITANYSVDSYTVGCFLQSLSLDYSILRMNYDELPITVRTLTASLFVNRFILTGAYREEKSERPYFNYTLTQLEARESKKEIFMGVQSLLGKHVMLSAYYNYYLSRDLSLAATLFF